MGSTRRAAHWALESDCVVVVCVLQSTSQRCRHALVRVRCCRVRSQAADSSCVCFSVRYRHDCSDVRGYLRCRLFVFLRVFLRLSGRCRLVLHKSVRGLHSVAALRVCVCAHACRVVCCECTAGCQHSRHCVLRYARVLVRAGGCLCVCLCYALPCTCCRCLHLDDALHCTALALSLRACRCL